MVDVDVSASLKKFKSFDSSGWLFLALLGSDGFFFKEDKVAFKTLISEISSAFVFLLRSLISKVLL
jgi:hypothetical protein